MPTNSYRPVASFSFCTRATELCDTLQALAATLVEQTPLVTNLVAFARLSSSRYSLSASVLERSVIFLKFEFAFPAFAESDPSASRSGAATLYCMVS